MIFEMRIYDLKIGATHAYVKHFEDVGLPIASKYCALVAYWIAETGKANRVIHVWSFADFEERGRARQKWHSDDDWKSKFLPPALPMVISQESIIMSAAPFSPVR